MRPAVQRIGTNKQFDIFIYIKLLEESIHTIPLNPSMTIVEWCEIKASTFFLINSKIVVGNAIK